MLVELAHSANAQVGLKLAIFDNPQPDPSRIETSQDLVNAYLAGINTAISVAAAKGIYIEEKEFFHMNNLPNIIQKASLVKMWQPNVIIGLSTSNEFLMSKAFFGDQLILSISATDEEVSTLPKNFYSLGIPDTDAVNAIIKFIDAHYKNANIFITVAAESKESTDFADLLANKYKINHPSNRVVESRFLTDDIEQLNLPNYMKEYKQGDVIVVMSMGYDSAINLMNKIAQYLKPIKPTFLTSTDNWSDDSIPQKMIGSYDAFRIDTLGGGRNESEYKIFVKNFEKIYHKYPTHKISFVTYQAVMSFITALKKYPAAPKQDATKAILRSYTKALQSNPNWFRPNSYSVYKITSEKELYFGTLQRS
jgi:hypothetical protein